MPPDRFSTADTWLANAATDLTLAREMQNAFLHERVSMPNKPPKWHWRRLWWRWPMITRAHVGDQLIRELQHLGETVPEDVIADANRLDLYYTGSRYPDALGGADPRKVLRRLML